MGFEVRGKGARSVARWTVAAAAGAGTMAVMSGAAFATQVTLGSGFPNNLQSESEWCAITCAQNILQYYGSSLQQCEEANYDFGQTDCCEYPSSSTCNPSTGSFTGTPLGYYGVHYTEYANNSFSFSQFESEINAGRPVSIGWNWNGGGGHAMNVAGYDTSTTSLLVYDPAVTAGCSMGDNPCWMTYTAYIGGPSPGYNHTAQAPLYDIYWSPVCSSDYYDIPGSEVQQCFDTWTHRGMEPIALTATLASGAVAYSGSYQTASGGYYMATALSSSAYSTLFSTMADDGYRPAVVNVNEWGGSWQIEALFRPAEGGFYSYMGMTASSFTSTNTTLAGEGFVIEDLYGYSDTSGNAYFAATWVDTTSNGQIPQIGISSSSFQSVFDTMADDGYYPAPISAYDNAGTTDYAVIWEHSPSGGFYADNGASVSSIESLDSSVAPSGYHPSYISALNNSFSGVFIQ